MKTYKILFFVFITVFLSYGGNLNAGESIEEPLVAQTGGNKNTEASDPKQNKDNIEKSSEQPVNNATENQQSEVNGGTDSDETASETKDLEPEEKLEIEQDPSKSDYEELKKKIDNLDEKIQKLSIGGFTILVIMLIVLIIFCLLMIILLLKSLKKDKLLREKQLQQDEEKNRQQSYTSKIDTRTGNNYQKRSSELRAVEVKSKVQAKPRFNYYMDSSARENRRTASVGDVYVDIPKSIFDKIFHGEKISMSSLLLEQRGNYLNAMFIVYGNDLFLNFHKYNSTKELKIEETKRESANLLCEIFDIIGEVPGYVVNCQPAKVIQRANGYLITSKGKIYLGN